MPSVLRGLLRGEDLPTRRQQSMVIDGIPFSGTLPANNRTVGPLDASGFQVVAFQLTGTFVATVVLEQSNDGITWYSSQINNIATGAVTTSVTTIGMYFVNVMGRYFRLRTTSYTSGTVGVSGIEKVGVAEGQQVVISGTPNVTMTAGTFTLNSMFFDEVATVLAISGVLTGSTRDVGVAASAGHRYESFVAFAFADQAGVMRTEMSRDGTTWRRSSQDQAVAAGEARTITVPIIARYHRMVYTNGGVAQTVFSPQTAFVG